MIEKVLIFIIVFIIAYEIYLLYLQQKIEINDYKKKPESTTINKEEETVTPVQQNKPFSFINNESSPTIVDDYSENIETDELIENIDPNMFGKPVEYKKNNIIVWSILEPKPWNKIIYNYNDKYPFKFFIKINVPSLNDYTNWKNIISNLEFDPRSGEIIISSQDEETALSIANLIISNFRGDLSIEEIIDKNLIDISINKAKKYDVVKNKIIEQIMNNLNNKPSELSKTTETFSTDLAKKTNDKNTETFAAYEGVEYSFF